MTEKKLEKKNKLTRNEIIIFVIVFSLLVLLTFFTRFYGTTDIKDYADVSKFLAGDYNAKIRSSHSYLFGFVHSPLVGLFGNFFAFKITSLVFLLLLIFSVYYISGRNKKSLWLMLASPIIWYMAPWASPIQLASLFLLWAFYFIKKYDESNDLKNLFFSGILIGLGWAFWDTVLFFGILLGASFLYNKKIIHGFYFVLFVIIGVLPKLILDQYLFGFFLYTTIRNLFAVISFSVLGGFYEQGSDFSLFRIIILLLFFIPWSTYIIFTKRVWKENKKIIIFVSLSILLTLSNPQIRISLAIIPIIISILPKYLDSKRLNIQIVIFLIISIIVINPYLIQVKYQTNAPEFENFVRNFNNLELNLTFSKDILLNDIDKISKKYPNQTFLVGNRMDEYSDFAHVYWGSNVKEFVSIQDYQLFLKNETTLQEKTLCTHVKLADRRDYCFSIWLRKAFNDDTDYASIKYALAPEDNLDAPGFKLVEKYDYLRVFEKL